MCKTPHNSQRNVRVLSNPRFCEGSGLSIICSIYKESGSEHCDLPKDILIISRDNNTQDVEILLHGHSTTRVLHKTFTNPNDYWKFQFANYNQSSSFNLSREM